MTPSNSLSFAQVTLNRPQAKLLTIMANDSYALASRATGKTQMMTAPWTLHKVEHMPRSSGGILGQTFEDLEKKIIDPLFQGFEMMGHELGVHYTYGTKPPEGWIKPYNPIVKWDRVIAFPNGTTCQMISLHQKGSANSLSLQWLIAPEAKFLNPKQLRSEVFPILRGNLRHFRNSPWYGAKFFETDKYGADIQWLLDKRKLVDKKAVALIFYWQRKYDELRARLATVSESYRFKIRAEMAKINRLLDVLRRNLTYVVEGNAHDNIANVGQAYIDAQQRDLTDYEFRIAILNEDPFKAEHGFYPNRGEQNMYMFEGNEDEDIFRPLAGVLDYQASISPLVWGQLNDRVLPGTRSLNMMGAMFVKHPLGIKDVIKNFCNHYQHRLCKEFIYFYDHTAKGERNMYGTYVDDVTKAFTRNGWKVIPVDMGLAPFHSTKYSKLNELLLNQDPDEIPIMIHKEGCNHMIVSMNLAGIKEGSAKGTEKDKSQEKDKDFPQELAPHLSDCFDQFVWAVCVKRLYPYTDRTIGRTAFR